MHRILKPGGRLYFSVNDQSAVKVFQGGGKDRARYIERSSPHHWEYCLAKLAADSDYQRFAAGEVKMVTMGRSTESHVMWDVEFLLKRWGPGWNLCSVTPEAYGHQTGVLLARV